MDFFHDNTSISSGLIKLCRFKKAGSQELLIRLHYKRPFMNVIAIITWKGDL